MYPGECGPFIMTLGHDFWSNYLDPNGFVLGEYRDPGHLEKNPFMYPLVKDQYLNQLGYHMIPIDNFLVFYIVSGNEVQIHRFLYGKRNYLEIL